MFNLIYHWIVLIWVPVLLFGVHKPHRWYALGFGVCSVILIHTLSELMTYIGYPNGIMSVMSSKVHSRLLIVSSIFYMLYLLLAHFSSKTMGVVFMAASLSVFFMIFVVGSIVMTL
ncbi:MAG: hypothetical protein ACLFU1_08445 [Alphaproteobacteria bacterium]